jgi:hypothetical protein
MTECGGEEAERLLPLVTATLDLGQKAAANDQQAMAIIRRISPVAWQHVNLFGTFEFSPTESTVDLDALAARYSDPGYWHQVLQEEQEAQVS